MRTGGDRIVVDGLDDALCGCQEFDAGAARTYVPNPDGLIPDRVVADAA